MNHPQDHFSAMASVYNNGRIAYPIALYEYLSSLCDGQQLAWDCATGSGQVTNDLSAYFDRVIATDISDSLLSHTKKIENVEFRCAPAEESGIDSDSLNLITVAQAIHWFDLQAFWKEAERVLKPNGILAYWGYLWPAVDHRVDALLEKFRESIASYWPEKSRLLHSLYEDVEAPFRPVNHPEFWIEEDWSAQQYLTHLASWSGTRYCREASNADPISEIKHDLISLWGNGQRTVRWPLIIKVYRNAVASCPI